VYERDGGRCTFVGKNGRRCRSGHNLHVDHIIPWARGGTHGLNNLRLMCATHNRALANAEFERTRALLKRE
jgi:5-methylcytosine-specific restriction endonuclease McrA